LTDGVALTFDDGPDPEWTPVLLDRLAELEVPATFFPISSRARAAPELIARIRRDGHEIGLHGAFHLDHRATPRDLLAHDTRLALDWLGEPAARLWRAPWGRVAPASIVIAREHGLRLIGWSLDTEDWRASSTIASVLERTDDGLRAGAVILLHDGVGPATRGTVRSTVELTVELLPALVDQIRSRGLEPKLID
jgi:peptidoglycan/xylan/chitin deacetylase (PgdA/CDA1 family)